MRIYDKVIWTNVATIYSLPERISKNTTIEIKLPSKYPVYVDPRKVVPEFARASKLNEDIPGLPEIPLPLAIALSFIPYGKFASTAHAGFAWTINYIAAESTNDVSVDIN